MLRIRIEETTNIRYENETKAFNKDNRYRTVIKSFKLNNGEINYFNSQLDVKVIPQKIIDQFTSIPFKQLETDSGQKILFQDPGDALHILKYDDGWIIAVPFDTLTEDDDIIIFDDIEEEWAIAGIKEIKIINSSVENEILEDQDLIDIPIDSIYKKISEELSPYMIKVENGIILNNIFVI